MASSSSGLTREAIFETDSDPESYPSSESSINNEDSTQSAAASSGKKRPAPKTKKRARLTAAEKLQAMQHYEANPGMTYDKLIDWCYAKFDMDKRLSKSAVSLWFSEKSGKRQIKSCLDVRNKCP